SLSTAPTSNVTVTVSRTSGNTGLSVSSGGTLTFTPGNFSTAQTVTIAADSSGTGAATFSATAPGYTTAAGSVTENSSNSTGTLLVNPASFTVAQGTSDVFGVSLSSAPSGNVSVTVGRTSGNSGLAISAGTTLTFTTSNWNYPQPVTVTADSSSTGNATFTASHVQQPGQRRVPEHDRDAHRQLPQRLGRPEPAHRPQYLHHPKHLREPVQGRSAPVPRRLVQPERRRPRPVPASEPQLLVHPLVRLRV